MINYLALGDSYTIGEGAKLHENWSSILTKNLESAGINTKLVANPSVTGFTTQDLIDSELHYIDELKPDFITLLIGVNDWVQGVSGDNFKTNLDYIIAYILHHVEFNSRVLLVTIPDFSAAPDGYKYAYGRNISEGLTKFNDIIVEAGQVNKIEVVDIFPISQRMLVEPNLVAEDNIHGSAKMYKLWEQLIFPSALKLLSE